MRARMLSGVPAFMQIGQIGGQLPLAFGTAPRTSRAFREGLRGKISTHDASAHVHLTADRSLSHSRLVQSQNLLIACITFVSTDLLLALGIGQGSKLHLLS